MGLEGLRVRNSIAQLAAEGQIQVTGSASAPLFSGHLVVAPGGRIQFARARTRIERGRVELRGYPENPLSIDVEGRSRVGGIPIVVRVVGEPQDLRFELSSDRSDLTRADLASLLLTGRTATATISDSGAIVAEEMINALGGLIQEDLGGAIFVDVSPDRHVVLDDTDPTQRFNVGYSIGDNLYVVYSTALGTGAQRWIVEYRPRAKLSLRSIAEEDNAFSIELFHRFGFDIWDSGTKGPPKRPKRKLTTVEFTGDSPFDRERLDKLADVKPGDAYEGAKLDAAVERLSRGHTEAGYPGAHVEVDASPTAESSEVAVSFEIEVGEPVVFQWTGDELGESQRLRIEELWTGHLDPATEATLLGERLRLELQAERYFEAHVLARAIEGVETAVRLHVVRGVRGRRLRIVFEGNESLDDKVLLGALPDRKDVELHDMLDDRRALQRAIRLKYAATGFTRVRVGRPQVRYDDVERQLNVTIPIVEGERAVVAALVLPEEVRDAESPPNLQLEEGGVFRLDAYIEDRNTLASWYRDQGYLNARLAAALKPEGDGLEVSFAVDAGHRLIAGEVQLATPGRTRDGVVKKAVKTVPGEPIRPTELAEGRERLAETGVYSLVDVRPEVGETAGVRNILVELREMPDLELAYGLRYTTEGSGQVGSSPSSQLGGRLQVSAGLDAANPFGRGHRYRIYGAFAGDRDLWGATYDAATFFGNRFNTQLFFYDERRRDLEAAGLATGIRTYAFQQTQRWRAHGALRSWRDRLRLQWGYRFRRVELTGLETGDPGPANRATLSLAFIGDTRDTFINATRGYFWTATTEVASKLLGSDVNYVKLFGRISWYVPLGDRVVLASGARLGVTPGDDPFLLLENRFQAGGASTVRGFPQWSLGPQIDEDTSLGGQASAVFNVELRFPMFGRWYGGVFYDAGNVWALSKDMNLGNLRHSAGFGIRYMLPFGPVRLDWGFVLDPLEGEDRSRLHFSLGHAF